MCGICKNCENMQANGQPDFEKAPCLSEEAKNRHRFLMLEKFLRREFRRFDLRHREQTIADTILELSFGWGQRAVRVPKLEIFSDLTGISAGNVHTALQSLHEMRILDIEVKDGGPNYSLNVDPEKWRCRPRISRSKVKQAVDLLKPYNGLSEDTEPQVTKAIEHLNGKGTPSNFSDLPVAISLEKVFPDLGNFPEQIPLSL